MKFLRACSKVTAVCFAIAFVISALIALTLFNVQNHYLKSDAYKNVLEEQQIYNRLPEILAKQIASSMTNNPCLENPEQCEGEDQGEDENNGPPSYLKNLSTEDWEQILSRVLTPEWTKSQVESSLDQFFTFLDTGEEKLNITISLVGLKTNLTGQKGMEIIRILVDAQPPCTETLLDTFIDMVAGDFTPDQLLMCCPPEELLDELTPTFEAALDLVIDDLPDEALLGKELFAGDDDPSTNTPNEGSELDFQTVRLVLRLSPFLPLLFLVLYTLFGVRSLQDFLLWWGIPFIILSLTALGAGLFAFPTLNWGVETFVLGRIPGAIDPSFIEILIDTTKLMVHSLVRVIANQAVVIGIIGLIMSGVALLKMGIFNSGKVTP